VLPTLSARCRRPVRSRVLVVRRRVVLGGVDMRVWARWMRAIWFGFGAVACGSAVSPPVEQVTPDASPGDGSGGATRDVSVDATGRERFPDDAGGGAPATARARAEPRTSAETGFVRSHGGRGLDLRCPSQFYARCLAWRLASVTAAAGLVEGQRSRHVTERVDLLLKRGHLLLGRATPSSPRDQLRRGVSGTELETDETSLTRRSR
jgi:hypothetical protein